MSNSQGMNPTNVWGNSIENVQDNENLNTSLHMRNEDADKSDVIEKSELENHHQGIFESLKNFTNMSRLLRISGALAVIASMSAFLMQDWSGGSDLTRYYLMLTQTLLLAAGGFGLSFLMKENKGGRVFFGLSLISITVNFTILGALIFSQVQWFGSIGQYPEFLTWTTTSIASLSTAIVSALIAMVPIALFSYMVFSRQHAKRLLMLFVISNLLLLVPVRDSLIVGVIVLASVLVPLWFLRKNMFKETSLKTPEGMFAVATVFLPGLVMLVRSFWLYEVDAILLVMLGSILFLMLRIFSAPLDENTNLKQILNWAGMGTAGFVAHQAGMASHALIPDVYGLSVTGVVFTALVLDLAKRAGNHTQLFVTIAVSGLLVCQYFLLLIKGGAVGAVMLLLAGLIVIAISQAYKSRGMFITGTVTALIGFTHQLFNTLINIDFTNWATLAVIGVSAIIIASLIERHGVVLKHKWDKWSHFKTTKEA
ncbi:MAG: hypothetical protein AAF304_03315 [Pseudomonadota bacterium]